MSNTASDHPPKRQKNEGKNLGAWDFILGLTQQRHQDGKEDQATQWLMGFVVAKFLCFVVKACLLILDRDSKLPSQNE